MTRVKKLLIPCWTNVVKLVRKICCTLNTFNLTCSKMHLYILCISIELLWYQSPSWSCILWTMKKSVVKHLWLMLLTLVKVGVEKLMVIHWNYNFHTIWIVLHANDLINIILNLPQMNETSQSIHAWRKHKLALMVQESLLKRELFA